jgi:hypothetical protein
MARLAACLAGLALVAASPEGRQAALGQALTFHASFDGKADGDFAAGEAAVYTALQNRLADSKPGLPEGVEIARGEGKYGDALRFARATKSVVLYRAAKNVSWAEGDFQGTLSVWLSIDPEKDLAPKTYCDPVQLTDKKWDDSCFFVDFDKEGEPRHFRLGVFSNYKEWNPQGTKWDQVPEEKRPWVVVKKHPFAGGKWTHVCFTWERFNTGRDDAVAKLYLNGELQGQVAGKKTYTWDQAKSAILLGFNYVGLYDDLSLFSRPLSADEVRALGTLEGGVRSLGRR